MWTPPNPVGAAQAAIRETMERFSGSPQSVNQSTAATISDTTDVPEHDFEAASPRNVWSVCGAKVNGRMCARPQRHVSHVGPNTTIACSVCTANQGSWTLCICNEACESKVCRHSVADVFDYRSVPVPRFQKD